MELSFVSKARVYCYHLGFLLPGRAAEDLDCEATAFIHYRLLVNANESGVEWISPVVDDLQLEVRVTDWEDEDFLYTTTLRWSNLKGWRLDTTRLTFSATEGSFYILGADVDFLQKTIALESNAWQLAT